MNLKVVDKTTHKIRFDRKYVVCVGDYMFISYASRTNGKFWFADNTRSFDLNQITQLAILTKETTQ